MNAKENWLAIYKGEPADRIPYSWEPFQGPAFGIFPIDPILMRDMVPQDGEDHLDSWGVPMCFPVNAPGQHDHSTPETRVVKDVKHWRDYVKVPDPSTYDWSDFKATADAVNRDEQLFMPAVLGGLFERSHYLIGFEEALMAYMMYPEEMKELVKIIADYKIQVIDLMYQYGKPDIIHFHDDWGTKQNVFLPPKIWREIIKPQEIRIAKAMHDRDIIYMHHSDCICEPYIEDMVEIGIDIWQGVIPQNNIKRIQKITNGKICLMGGIDGPTIDKVGQSEEKIRAEVRRAIDEYCPAGRFFPCIPNLVPFTERALNILRDEMTKYGAEWYTKNKK